MAIIADSKRKNAFSHRLKSKRREPSDTSGMSADQIKVAGKMHEDVIRSIFNLGCVIRSPSETQAEIINGWLHDLNARLNDIQRTLPL